MRSKLVVPLIKRPHLLDKGSPKREEDVEEGNGATPWDLSLSRGRKEESTKETMTREKLKNQVKEILGETKERNVKVLQRMGITRAGPLRLPLHQYHGCL